MIKLVYCIHRRADLSFEDFSRTWLIDHAPLVRRYAEAIRVVRYVQSHSQQPALNQALQASRADMGPGYDGITELWWDSLAAFEEGMSQPDAIEAGRALKRDEERFIDFSRSTMFLTQEHEILSRG
ncbi:MAG: EthD domain-containing protein [Pseudomonadota bacterium]